MVQLIQIFIYLNPLPNLILTAFCKLLHQLNLLIPLLTSFITGGATDKFCTHSVSINYDSYSLSQF